MDKTGRDARLALLAGRQAGAFAYEQVVRLGYPSSTAMRRVDRGLWERRFAGVYVLAGSERTRSQDLWCGLLAAGHGARVSHESSALLHGAERLFHKPITLTTPHGWRHHLRGVLVHQIDDAAPWQVTQIDGMPVSTAARSVVELAATQSIESIGRTADELINMKATSLAAIAAVLAHVSRPGKPGLAKVAAVLDQRGDGYVPPASELEYVFFAALEAGGLPVPARQVRLPGRDPMRRGLVDGAYLDAQMVFEVDGRRWHDRLAASRSDRVRDAHVVRHGWVPLRFVYEQIVHDPAEVCAIVAESRAVRLTQLRRAA